MQTTTKPPQIAGKESARGQRRGADDRLEIRAAPADIPPNRAKYERSEAKFRAMILTEVLQRSIGIRYNFAFLEGDGSDARNLFIHGILTGFGGTCASLPVLYVAIGRRLGYAEEL